MAQDVEHLLSYADHRSDLVALHQRRTDIHHNETLRALGARDIDRQIAGQAAIDQQTAIDFDWREHAGDGHAGADRAHQVALVQHDHVAGLDVRGDGAVGDGQVVEGVQ